MTFTFKYFAGCKSLNDIKQIYRRLAMEHHPDKGGSADIFRAVTDEYNAATRYFAKYGPMNDAGQHDQEQTTEAQESAIFENDAYRAALDAVINIEGIIIEVVGSWIWITGTTYPHRAKFSAAGYIFAGAKKAWYFRTEENRTTRSKKGTTLDDIRNKYGSERVNNYKPANRIGGSAAA